MGNETEIEYVRGLEDGLEIAQEAVSRLLDKRMPVEKLKSQLLLEVRYFVEKARGRRLGVAIQTLEDSYTGH